MITSPSLAILCLSSSSVLLLLLLLLHVLLRVLLHILHHLPGAVLCACRLYLFRSVNRLLALLLLGLHDHVRRRFGHWHQGIGLFPKSVSAESFPSDGNDEV